MLNLGKFYLTMFYFLSFSFLLFVVLFSNGLVAAATCSLGAAIFLFFVGYEITLLNGFKKFKTFKVMTKHRISWISSSDKRFSQKQKDNLVLFCKALKGATSSAGKNLDLFFYDGFSGQESFVLIGDINQVLIGMFSKGLIANVPLIPIGTVQDDDLKTYRVYFLYR